MNDTAAANSAPTPPQGKSVSQRDRLVALWTVGALLFFLVAIFARFYDRFPGDELLTDAFQGVDVPGLGGYLDLVNTLGDTWLHAALVVGIAVLFALRRAAPEATLVVYTFLPSLVNGVIKGWVERARPSAELVDVHDLIGGFSFPSGHTVGTSAFMLALFFALPALVPQKALRWLLQFGCLLFMVSAGPARVYIGVHWPSDVAAGYLLAALFVAPAVLTYLRFR